MPKIKQEIREAIPLEIGEEHEIAWHIARRTLERWEHTFTSAVFVLLERDGQRFIRRVEPGARQPRLWGDRHPRARMQPGDSIPGTGRSSWSLAANWSRRYAPARYEARRDPETREVRIWRIT